jgi:hypothetical protein
MSLSSGMASINEIFLSGALGIFAVTLIDVLGSITSRKWNYNYAYLTPLSFVVYTMIGYYVSQTASLNWALIIGSLVGIYDGTIGWRLAIIFNANMGEQKEAALKMDTQTRILFMIIISTFFGFLGTLLAG